MTMLGEVIGDAGVTFAIVVVVVDDVVVGGADDAPQAASENPPDTTLSATRKCRPLITASPEEVDRGWRMSRGKWL